MSATNPMAPAEPIELKRAQKECDICGAKFVPTSGNQKHCPECRAAIKCGKKPSDKELAYKKARQPGPVTAYKMEIPEARVQQPETPEDPIIPDGIKHGYSDLMKAIELPDGLAIIEEHAEILRRYYTGELVDKAELLAEIREKFKNFLEV